MRIVANVDEIDRAQWLGARRHGIGGSDAATIMGHSRFQSIEDLFADKAGIENDPGFDEDSEAAYWGRTLEPVVAQEFAKRNDLLVVRAPWILQSEEYPWMLANLDRLVFPPVGDLRSVAPEALAEGFVQGMIQGEVLEIKTTSAFLAKSWNGEEPPPWVVDQVTHYTVVTGVQGAWVACLVGGRGWVQFYLPRDEGYCQELVEAERQFWDMVGAGPQAAQSLETLVQRHAEMAQLPAAPMNQLEVGETPAIRAATLYYVTHALQSRLHEKAMKTYRTTILQSAEGQGDVVLTVDGIPRLAIASRSTTRLPSGELKKLYPDVWRSLSQTSSYQTITILGGREEE